jgi:hypothetical protein
VLSGQCGAKIYDVIIIKIKIRVDLIIIIINMRIPATAGLVAACGTCEMLWC